MLCVETPISIRVPTIARASFTDKSSWPTWTPSASTAAAISARSLTMQTSSWLAAACQLADRAFVRACDQARGRPNACREAGSSRRPLRPASPTSRSNSTAESQPSTSTQRRTSLKSVSARPTYVDRLFQRVEPVAQRFHSAGEFAVHQLCHTLPGSAAIARSASDWPRKRPRHRSLRSSASVEIVVPTSRCVSRAACRSSVEIAAAAAAKSCRSAFACACQKRIVEHEPHVVFDHPQPFRGSVQRGIENPHNRGLRHVGPSRLLSGDHRQFTLDHTAQPILRTEYAKSGLSLKFNGRN